jgi:hypothetical protein
MEIEREYEKDNGTELTSGPHQQVVTNESQRLRNGMLHKDKP